MLDYRNKGEAKITSHKGMLIDYTTKDTIPICLHGEPILKSSEYLGSILESTCSVDREVDGRLQKAGTACVSDISCNLSIATMQGTGMPITGGVSASLWYS